MFFVPDSSRTAASVTTATLKRCQEKRENEEERNPKSSEGKQEVFYSAGWYY